MAVNLTGRQRSELRYLMRRQPLWKMVPPSLADGDLEFYITHGLVKWKNGEGYRISPAGLATLEQAEKDDGRD